jgi:hypothetical protein
LFSAIQPTGAATDTVIIVNSKRWSELVARIAIEDAKKIEGWAAIYS